MLTATLLRTYLSCNNCDYTAGTLEICGYKFATLELPWKENKRNESCIPCGTYICRRIKSPKFGETFEVCWVLNRDKILIHRGNFLKETRGCILLAETCENGRLYHSLKGMEKFLEVTKGINEFQLTIEVKE